MLTTVSPVGAHTVALQPDLAQPSPVNPCFASVVDLVALASAAGDCGWRVPLQAQETKKVRRIAATERFLSPSIIVSPRFWRCSATMILLGCPIWIVQNLIVRKKGLLQMAIDERRVFPLGFLLRIASLLFVYFVTRILFFWFNHKTLNSFSAAEIVRAFALGFRFDAWVVSATMLPMFFFEVWSWKSRSMLAHRVTRGFSFFILALHSIFIFLELADTQYFRFTGRRTTLAILELSSDSIEQSFQLLRNFWIVPVGTVILMAGLAWVWRKSRSLWTTASAPVHPVQVLSVVILGLVIGVLGLRGGLQTKPIATAHAMLLGQSQLAALALSTSFQVTHSAENRQLKLQSFFSTEQEVRRILNVPRERHSPVKLENFNVVILVVESLSSEYMGYGGINSVYAPFIRRLADKSLYFDNAYSNGLSSIEAFPSLLACLPSLVGEPFITSQYSSVKTQSLGHVLAARGYSNEFFHGCNNGSMYIDSMAKLFGFPRFFGRYDYPPGDKDYDGSWGIYDEPFLQFAASRIGEIKSPFAVGIFTLSSHNPYKIPQHLQQRFSGGKLPFQNSLAYTDHAIEKFFESAEKQAWFKNTLFVITGDHTSDLESSKFMSEQALYRVPLIFYDPSGQLKPAVSHRIVQHADVFPSVLDLLGVDETSLEKPMLPLGQSVFLPENFARAANRAGDSFWYQEGKTVVRFPADGSAFGVQELDNAVHAAAHDFKLEIVPLMDDTLTPAAARAPTEFETQGIVERAKAYLQFFNNRMSHNSLLEP
ncbi:MAG: LTA synthase family protein [Silvanigrellaceae bacterium]